MSVIGATADVIRSQRVFRLLTLDGPKARALASMATSMRRGCQRRTDHCPRRLRPGEKLSVRLAVRSNDRYWITHAEIVSAPSSSMSGAVSLRGIVSSGNGVGTGL